MKTHLTRRDLLLAAGTALPLSRMEAANVQDQPIPIIDTHQHLWDLGLFHLPWLAGNPKLNRSFVMKDYREATAGLTGLNVVKTVYMEVDVDPAEQVAEAEYVSALCAAKDNRMAAAVISGRPASDLFKDYLDRFRGNPHLRGIRQVLHGAGTPAGYCLQAGFVKGIRLLGERGWSFDLCMRSGELGDGVKLVDQCKDTRFILDHCGNTSPQAADRTQWERDLGALAHRPNVICKVSGIVASAKEDWKPADLAPIVDRVIAEFGIDRVVFGGDWPVCTLRATYKQWAEALRWIVRERKPEEQRKLFHDNAARFYRLTG